MQRSDLVHLMIVASDYSDPRLIDQVVNTEVRPYLNSNPADLKIVSLLTVLQRRRAALTSSAGGR